MSNGQLPPLNYNDITKIYRTEQGSTEISEIRKDFYPSLREYIERMKKESDAFATLMKPGQVDTVAALAQLDKLLPRPGYGILHHQSLDRHIGRERIDRKMVHFHGKAGASMNPGNDQAG